MEKQIMGYPSTSGRPCNKDCSILGSVSESPYLGTLSYMGDC